MQNATGVEVEKYTPGALEYSSGIATFILVVLAAIVSAALAIWQRHRFSNRWCHCSGKEKTEGDVESGVNEQVKQIVTTTINISRDLNELSKAVAKLPTPPGTSLAASSSSLSVRGNR
jgi:hypothetical protein